MQFDDKFLINKDYANQVEVMEWIKWVNENEHTATKAKTDTVVTPGEAKELTFVPIQYNLN